MFSYSSQRAVDQTASVASRMIFITALLGAATAVSAQTPRPSTMRPAQSCSESETVGWLGISGLNCTNCVFTAPGRGEPILFGTEPRITSVASGSPASEVIHPGDVLVSVDGALITTHAGGTRFHNLKPGQDVTVVIRRNGEPQSYRLIDLPPICRTDSRVPGWQIPPGDYVSGARVAQTYGRGVMPTPQAPRSPLPPGAVGATTVPRSPVPPPDARAGALARTRMSVPRASFGFSISCGNCRSMVAPDDGTVRWEFEESPQIYSVDANSEAYRAGIRRGDVITRIDGLLITSPEGGRRFGAVVPGQRVEFTIRRGSQTLSRAVRAEPTRGGNLAMAARERENSLGQARRLTEELQRQERVQSAQLDQLRRNDDEQIRTWVEQLRRQQTEKNAQLTQLQAELARADRELNAVVGATRPAPGRAGGRSNTVITVPGDRTMRYVGRIGDIDIEVRGGSQIRVAETPSEYVITIGDSEIRLKKNNPPR
ncbi:MAG: PDZ domain-containing protein [Gemmatimonadota bacterium]